MNVLGLNCGHDGALANVEDGTLVYVREGEKGSRRRHTPLGADDLLYWLTATRQLPDVVAHSGWWKGTPGGPTFATGAGYYGIEIPTPQSSQVLGHKSMIVRTSHERSHIWCSLGMAPPYPGAECQVLVWEGDLGCFYRVACDGTIHRIGNVLSEPGSRYLFAYALADPNVSDSADPTLLIENAGKQMALAAYDDGQGTLLPEQAQLLSQLLECPSSYRLRKSEFRSHPLYNSGVNSLEYKQFARAITDALFKRFEAFADKNLDVAQPLVLGGGCALNCEWNTRFREKWHADVFVPPCPNDSGVAIGAAIDAQQLLGGSNRIRWRANCGEEFEIDRIPQSPWTALAADPANIARLLKEGAVLGWVNGQSEIGPRALGYRSILASPFDAAMTVRLNKIKQRESFRPIAPVCQIERVREYFDWSDPSPHMLYFQRVRDPRLAAVTHVDGTARVQTITANENPKLWHLIDAFGKLTGCAVLCNTSLNFKGLGFINAMSELEQFALTHGLDGFVVNDRLWVKEGRQA